MDSAELKAGKARVDGCLIEPLTDKGMVRPKGQTIAKFNETLDALRARLSYLTEKELVALAQVVEHLATGKAKNTWPMEITICNQARCLRPPPPSDSALVRRTMQSHHGRNAVAGGYAVALYGWVKKYGRFPNDYVITSIKQKGAEYQAWLSRLDAMTHVEGEDARFLKWYRSQEARVQSIILKGEAAA